MSASESATPILFTEMRVPFPTREELLARGKLKEYVDELYDLWLVAHEEAMALAIRLPEVFGDPPRPRITLHVARGYDDEWTLSMERGLELTAMDPEQHWTEVTAEATFHFQEYFVFADGEGWRFYLPAYLRHYLGEFPICDQKAVQDFCIDRAAYRGDNSFAEAFSPQQIEFIDEFIALCHTWE